MSERPLDKPANPVPLPCAWGGTTARMDYAAQLRIPESGDPELDAMIRKAQRRDLAAKAMQGLLAGGMNIHDSATARIAATQADALLAALDRDTEKEGGGR